MDRLRTWDHLNREVIEYEKRAVLLNHFTYLTEDCKPCLGCKTKTYFLEPVKQRTYDRHDSRA